MFDWLKKDSEAEVRSGITRIYPRLWRYCFVLAGSKADADDLLQAACLRALEKAKSFKAGSKFDHWMFRLTQRLWYNELRKQAIRKGQGLLSIEEANLVDANSNPENNAIGRDTLMHVLQLPEAQRQAVVLVYIEGNSYRDAAMILDVPVGTIMSRLAVARGKLAQKLGSESAVG